MASSAKRKTTMAKLNRESKLRERRLTKQAKKEARRHAPASELDPATIEATEPGGGQSPEAPVSQTPSEVN